MALNAASERHLSLRPSDRYYYDPMSTPWQKLQLKVSKEGRAGQSFAAFSFR
jgi:hypothetical protein